MNSLNPSSAIDPVTAYAIRLETLDHLRVYGIRQEIPLPLISSEFELRPSRELVGRALALSVTVAVSFGFDRQKALHWLVNSGQLEFLPGSERAFVTTGSADAPAFHGKVEALFAIAWALNVADGFSSKELCPTTLVSTFPNLKANESPEHFIRMCQPRPFLEVVRQADLYYCLHWYVRELRFGPLSGNLPLPAYAVVERRRMLEWMLGRDDWDGVRLDT